MDQHAVEMGVERGNGFSVAPRLLLLLQDVAHRGEKLWPRLCRLDGVEQRQQFEPHLPTAEGKGLDDDDVRSRRMKGRKQPVAAVVQECLVNRRAILVGKS